MQVPKHLKVLSKKEKSIIEYEIQSNTSLGKKWLEKLRRYVSYYNHNLYSEAKSRFGYVYKDELIWYAKIFKLEIEKNRYHPPFDNSYFNAFMLINNALPGSIGINEYAKNVIADIKQALIDNNSKIKISKPSPKLINNFNHLLSESSYVKGVILLCPTPFSLFSLTVAELCIKLDIEIIAIYTLKFTAKRFFYELKRDGLKLFAKRIWRKLILRGDENNHASKVSLKKLHELVADHKDIKKFSRDNKIDYFEIKEFSEIKKLSKAEGIFSVFTGGGLINQETLENLDNKIINTHMGLLPHYKGMDVVESPLLDGQLDAVALNTHLMTEGLDEGPLVQMMSFNPDDYECIDELRNEISAFMPIIALDSLCGLASERLKPISQDLSLGKQYFFIENRLISMINDVMKSRNNNDLTKQVYRNKNISLFNNFVKLFLK